MAMHRLQRRALSTLTDRRQILPILRLPTTLFPSQCFSIALDPPEHERRYNVLTPAQMHEAWSDHGGRFATLAWGMSVGVELKLLDDAAARDSDAPVPTPPGIAHAVGGRRLQLLQLLEERSASGCRLGLVEPLDDAADASEAARLRSKAEAARKLLGGGAATPIELSLCTLDEELRLGVCDPRAHPLWRSQAAPPRDDAALSLWLAARLSLTTALRGHLLACTDPLKRMRDCVDAMRLLANPRQPKPPFAKFQVVWDTAESGGCELEPPVPTIDWAKHDHK